MDFIVYIYLTHARSRMLDKHKHIDRDAENGECEYVCVWVLNLTWVIYYDDRCDATAHKEYNNIFPGQ